MSKSLTVKYLDSSEFEEWDKFVDRSENGSIYSKSYFLEALSQVYSAGYRILAVYKNDELMGGVGIYFNKTRYGDKVHIPPLLYYNGLVIKEFPTKYPSVLTYKQLDIVNAIIDELEGGNYASVDLSSRYSFQDLRAFAWRGWKIWPRYTYVVPISDLNQQWNYVEQNVRRLINRCESENMSIVIDDDIETFIQLYQGTYQRKGLTSYINRDRFLKVYQTLKKHDACQIYYVSLPNGQRIATQVVLMTEHPVTHTWMAGSDPEFLKTGASAFLRWKVFEDLNRRGYAFNDLTDATIASVAKFKSQFGGNLEQSFVVYKVMSARLKLHNKFKSVLSRPIKFLQTRLERD